MGTSSKSEKDICQELYRAYRSGDDYAFTRLYTILGKRLLASAVGILRNQQDAEDALHEALAKAYPHLLSESKVINDVRHYLFTAVRHTCFSRLDKRKWAHEEFLDELHGDEYGEALDQGEIQQRNRWLIKHFYHIVGGFNVDRHFVIVQKWIHSRPMREIAEDLGVETQRAKNIYDSGMQTLKRLMKKADAEQRSTLITPTDPT